MFRNKYHLPHNSIRVDEFKFMLEVLDKSKEFYLYDDLRLLFLYEEIKQDKFKIFHKIPDCKLRNHSDQSIRDLYCKILKNPSVELVSELMEVQYTDKKTFKKVWNEFVRDYTEFFAFLGLLPTYYKGVGGDSAKKHYLTQRLRDFLDNKISFNDIILGLKFRNSSKNNDSLDMYNIKVRPFYIALKVLEYCANKGYDYIDIHILSAIVVYAKDEFRISELCDSFDDLTKSLKDYAHLFYLPVDVTANYIDRLVDEIGRVTLFIKPYLKAMEVVETVKVGKSTKYKILKDKLNFDTIPSRSIYCNEYVGALKLTPLIGKILNTCYRYSKSNAKVQVKVNEIFDNHFDDIDKEIILKEFTNLNIWEIENDNIILNTTANQVAINPYTDFFTIEDANYVDSIGDLTISEDSQIIVNEKTQFDKDLELLEPVAYGSNGPLYEEKLFDIINNNFSVFKNKKWYGAAATGKRISDIAFTVDIFDNNMKKKILVVLECKAGKAIKSFDERKEIDDVQKLLLAYPDKNFDGIWYWVVNGNSLPSSNNHGGYRHNDYSMTLLQKLNEIQFSVSEYSRRPTIVTAFSFSAISEYLKYIYLKTQNQTEITPFIVPHFWKWSKKFMNLQYVMIHKELNMGA